MCSTISGMSARMSQPVVRRPNLPLTARDEADLEQIRSSLEFRRALERMAPSQPQADASLGEAVLLHAVFEAGLAAVRAAAEEDGYRQLGQQYTEQQAERRRIARRRKPAWADES